METYIKIYINIKVIKWEQKYVHALVKSCLFSNH